jgi:uncharacterized protein (UPF0332 family)
VAGSLKEAEGWLKKAEETLDAAKALKDRRFYNDSLSRTYYAMFYAAKGAVISQGVETKKHSRVISAFGRLFAKTGRLDPQLHRALMLAYKQRELADYRLGAAAPEEVSTQALKAAEDFVIAVKSFLAMGVE